MSDSELGFKNAYEDHYKNYNIAVLLILCFKYYDTCMCHQDQEILLVIYVAHKMVYLHTVVSRAARAAL